jgi:hypothetical protein
VCYTRLKSGNKQVCTKWFIGAEVNITNIEHMTKIMNSIFWCKKHRKNNSDLSFHDVCISFSLLSSRMDGNQHINIKFTIPVSGHTIWRLTGSSLPPKRSPVCRFIFGKSTFQWIDFVCTSSDVVFGHLCAQQLG